MRLEYQIAATGANQLKRVLRSVEQEQRASNMRAANASAKMWARQLAAVKREIARVEARGIRRGRAPVAPRNIPASGTAERRLHAARMSEIAAEGAARKRVIAANLAAEKAAGRLRTARMPDRPRLREAIAIKEKARSAIPRPERQRVRAALAARDAIKPTPTARPVDTGHKARMSQIAAEERARLRSITKTASAERAAANVRRQAAQLAGVPAAPKVRRSMSTQAHQDYLAKLAHKSATSENAMRLRNARREGDARITAIKSAALEEKRAENYRHRLKLRNIEREKRREIAGLVRARVKREQSAEGRRQLASRVLTRGVGGALAGVGRMAAGVGMLGGGFAAFGAVRNQMETEAAASTLANKALGTPGEKRNREQIRTDVIKQARGLGAKTGLGAQGVVGALSSFTAISGRLGMGQQLAPFMADVADATGAAIEDVGRTSGQIVQAMMARGMKEPEALAQTKEIITAMMAQAKVGSIEFADLATQMGKVMSSTAAFDGKVSDLTTTMGALAQLAIAGAASSPEEAMTSILRFRDDLIKNAARFQKQGINVFADKGKTRLRKPEELMVEMLEKTKGSLPKVGKLFGIRAAKAVTPFQALYTEKGGGEVGIKAVRDLLETAKATIPQTEVTRSAAFRRQDADKQLAMTVEKFNAAVGSQLLPVLTQLIPKFTDMIPQIADMTKAFAGFASWAIENPLQGLGAIIGAKIAAETASAAIGPAVSKGLTSLFQRAPIGSLSLGAATFAVTAGTIIIEALASSKDAGSRVSAENTAKRGAALANAEVVRQRAAQVSLSKEGKPIDETPQAALARISGITPRGKELLTTAESTMQNVQRINDVATQGVWETLVNTITGQGPGIKAVWQAQEEQKGSAKAIEDTGAMLKTLESMVTLQKDALAEPIKQLNVAAKGMQMAADKMQTVADNPPAPTPDSPRRNSPVLNR